MRYRELDLNLLMALDRLIRLRSVSRAADEMSVTQSAMSNMLARLREYFDDPLLMQVGRQMEPTARALDLAEPIRDILVRIEATVRGPSQFEPASSTRTFSMMVSDYSLMTVIPVVVQRVARLAPRVKLHFTPQVMQPAVQVEQGGADLVIAPGMYCSTDHPSEALLHDPLVCVMDEGNPLAGKLDVEALRTAEHVTMQPPGDAEAYSLTALAQVGINVDTPIKSYSFASLPALVRGTNRIAVVQSQLARAMTRGAGFVVVEPPVALKPLEQRLLWHKLRGPDPGIQWLRGQTLEAARELQAQVD
ncbi:MAG: LysR family transcriptional regulator [Pseudomonadota bacterium]|nr:LysR family transcriptional regulator [Pseudomonadota bacterium]